MKTRIFNFQLSKRLSLFFISLCFLIWSTVLLYNASFIAIDGKRYSVLFDDALVSMRYAWNLAHGHGLVWNPGERVEGYTNLLMTLVMTIPASIFNKTDALIAIQVLGIGLMLGIAFLAVKIATMTYGGNPLPKEVFFALALLYYPLNYWTLNGMETGLLTLLMYLGILFAFKFVQSTRFIDLALVSVSLGLAYLTRPDSLIQSALILGYILVASFRARDQRMWVLEMFVAVVILAAFILGQLIFRWSYYGELVPNTYTLKVVGFPIIDRRKNGTNFVIPYLKENILVFLVIFGSILGKPRLKVTLFTVLLASSILYQIWVGGDAWPYWRLMAPYMPLAFILFAVTIAKFVEKTTSYFSLYIQTLTIVLAIIAANASFLSQAFFLEAPFQSWHKARWVNQSIAIHELTSSDATLGVTAAGTFPYFTDRVSIDILGKNDPHIASLQPDLSGATFGPSMPGVYVWPGHNKYDLNYSVKYLQPTFAQHLIWGSQDLINWADNKYVCIEYKDTQLHLLKDSPQVSWNLIDQESIHPVSSLRCENVTNLFREH